MNQAEIDEAALAAEADAAAAIADSSAPLGAVNTDAAGAGPPALAAEAGESWKGVIESITVLMRDIVLMQWHVTAEQWKAWEEGLTRSMDACFPGGIEGKYGGFVQAGLIAAGVTVSNYVIHGRKLPPLGPPRRDVQQKAEAASAGSQN